MPNWQALPCELKLQIYRDLIDAELRFSPHWLFTPEPSDTILHGVHDLLLVAPELRQHTLELVEKLLIIETSDFGLEKDTSCSRFRSLVQGGAGEAARKKSSS